MAIFADSTTSVEAGDLLNAKIHSQLNGIRCQLLNKDKQKKFWRSFKNLFKK